MTASELIKELEKYPPNMDVLTKKVHELINIKYI